MYSYDIISLDYSQNEKYSRQVCTEYQDIHLIVNVFLLIENLAVFEIFCKNMFKSNMPQITIYYGACALHAG